MVVFAPQESVNTAEISKHCKPGLFFLKRQVLNIYKQTPACHPHKICEQNLSSFSDQFNPFLSLISGRKEKNPFLVILPSLYTAFAISLLEILRYLTNATPRAFSPLSCFLLNACCSFFECAGVCPQRDTQAVDVQTPAHPAKKAQRPPTSSMAPWMQSLPDVPVSWLPLPCIFLNSLLFQSDHRLHWRQTGILWP